MLEDKKMEDLKKAFPPGCVVVRALDSKVLAVARIGYVNDYAVYIGAVKGVSHALEAFEVAANGSKLPKKVAEVLFPHLTRIYSYRE